MHSLVDKVGWAATRTQAPVSSEIASSFLHQPSEAKRGTPIALLSSETPKASTQRLLEANTGTYSCTRSLARANVLLAVCLGHSRSSCTVCGIAMRVQGTESRHTRTSILLHKRGSPSTPTSHLLGAWWRRTVSPWF